MPPALTYVAGAKGGSSIEGSSLGSSEHSLADMSGASVKDQTIVVAGLKIVPRVGPQQQDQTRVLVVRGHLQPE